MKTKCNFKELVVLVALLFSSLFSNMKAQNGVCGDNLTWSFNSETGELTITGTGEMYDYYYFTAPWYPYEANIEKLNIGNGITYIGKYSFNGLMNIQEVTIPNTVEIIGDDSFDNCGSLRIVNIPPFSLNDFDILAGFEPCETKSILSHASISCILTSSKCL